MRRLLLSLFYECRVNVSTVARNRVKLPHCTLQSPDGSEIDVTSPLPITRADLVILQQLLSLGSTPRPAVVLQLSSGPNFTSPRVPAGVYLGEWAFSTMHLVRIAAPLRADFVSTVYKLAPYTYRQRIGCNTKAISCHDYFSIDSNSRSRASSAKCLFVWWHDHPDIAVRLDSSRICCW